MPIWAWIFFFAIFLWFVWDKLSDFLKGEAAPGKFDSPVMRRTENPFTFWCFTALNFSLIVVGGVAFVAWALEEFASRS